MSKRDPSGPIPGFEEEFTGTVGNEKRIHKTHWSGIGKPWASGESDDDNWEEVRPGRWVRKQRTVKNAIHSE